MTSTSQKLTITRPDDWHVHLRDDVMLKAVLPYTAREFARAIVMPNLRPPVTTAARAQTYRDEILAALPQGMSFTPLMTIYLTDATDPDDLARGHAEGVVTAAKLYPAHATTNSEHGVTDIGKIYPVLERMQKIGMPLLVHGEVTDADVDVFDRESAFIDRVLIPLRRDMPQLKIVFEHITTAEAAAYVRAEGQGGFVAATITPHHLLINRNAMFKGGIRPHYYCLPVAKREHHRLALVQAATSGDKMFFLGTDTAPHARTAKESACGCAGIFCAPNALGLYAQVFDEAGKLEMFESFAALNGSNFYGLPLNQGQVTLIKYHEEHREIKPILTAAGQELEPFVPLSPISGISPKVFRLKELSSQMSAKLDDLPFIDLYVRLDKPDQALYRSKIRGQNTINQLVPEEYEAAIGRFMLAVNEVLGAGNDGSIDFEGVRCRLSKQNMSDYSSWVCARRITTVLPILKDLGFPQAYYEHMHGLGKRDGLILISGATGQGKTTTAVALLTDFLRSYGGAAVTIEDPVEYNLKGRHGDGGHCFQVEVRAEEEWAVCLKRALRWAPRYIYVGEIRTPKAAEQVLRAATTGHLVITTVHAGTIEEALMGLIFLAEQAMGPGVENILSAGLSAITSQIMLPSGPKLKYAYTEPDSPGDPIRSLIREKKIGMMSTYVDRIEARLAVGGNTPAPTSFSAANISAPVGGRPSGPTPTGGQRTGGLPRPIQAPMDDPNKPPFKKS